METSLNKQKFHSGTVLINVENQGAEAVNFQHCPPDRWPLIDSPNHSVKSNSPIFSSWRHDNLISGPRDIGHECLMKEDLEAFRKSMSTALWTLWALHRFLSWNNYLTLNFGASPTSHITIPTLGQKHTTISLRQLLSSSFSIDDSTRQEIKA